MGLRQVGGALWRQRLLAMLILVVTALAAVVGLQLAAKSYTATATLVTTAAPGDTAGGATADGDTADGDTVGGDATDDVDALRATVAALAASPDVVAAATAEVRADRDPGAVVENITGRWVPGTVLIEVSATDRDPEVAADLANAVARTLPRYDTSGAFVFTVGERAVPPATWSSPDLLMVVGLGLVVALGGAVIGSALRDSRTRTVADGAGAEEATSAPLLAHLRAPDDPSSMPALTPGTAAAEVFITLVTSLEAQSAKRPAARVVVAGVSAGEASAWIAANVAISLAGTGREILLVDGRLGSRFGVPGPGEPDTPGLYDVLAGTPLEEAISPGPVPGLTVLPPGGAGLEPPQSWIEQRFATVMEQAQQDADVVVVIGPALDASDDARVMAAGGVLLLAVPEGRLVASELRAHADRVRAAGGRLVGVVLVGPGDTPVDVDPGGR